METTQRALAKMNMRETLQWIADQEPATQEMTQLQGICQAARAALSPKPCDEEVHVKYCTIYQTKEGLPVMTDSSETSTWDVRLTFSNKRNAWGDFLNPSPTSIETTK